MPVARAAAAVAWTRPFSPLLVAPLLMLFVAEAEARASNDLERNASTRAAFGALCLLFILCGGGIGWCIYLECRPETPRTRSILLLALTVATLVDITLCVQGYFVWWMFPVVVVANTWGPLDAVLRFPVVHDLDSIFAVKHFSLVVLKGAAYIFAVESFSSNRIAFFTVFMVNVIGLPLMYLLALPLDEVSGEQACAARDVVDVDIAIRLWQLVVDHQSRREWALECKRRARVAAIGAAQRCPATGRAFCYFDPQLKRALQKTGRDV